MKKLGISGRNWWKYVNVAFVLLILADILFSFFQHLHMPLDGDMAGIILPSKAYEPLMNDPFGMGVLLHDRIYASPNRFFAHWLMAGYFKTMPFFLQNFVNPLNSIYLASAIAKTTIQVFLIWILSKYISGAGKICIKNILLAAILIVPMFQTDGYNSLMGIIDRSVTYTFFYALPFGLLLTFFYPFYKKYFLKTENKWGPILKICLLVLTVFLSFNGPLIPGNVLLVCPLTLVSIFWNGLKNYPGQPFIQKMTNVFRAFPKDILWYFLLISSLCAYSLVIGFNSAENPVELVPLSDRYSLLGLGLVKLTTQKLGFPLIILMIAANSLIIRFNKPKDDYRLIMKITNWIAVISILYLVLLPLGGYREYRPNIIRRDTLMPVIVAIIYLYGSTTFYILHQVSMKRKTWYKLLVVGILIFFTLNDNPDFTQDRCERQAIIEIAASDQTIVKLEGDCTVMAWRKMTDYQESEVRGKLLLYWGVTDEMKYYYQE